MDPINIPERLDPSSRIGDAQPDRSGEKRESRRKKVKRQIPPAADAPSDPDDESHQLDELV
jgi:hypothetical protein